MTFGLRCLSPACRPHPASPPVRVPAVESLLRASFGFASRLRLAFRYGCRHRPRLAPFIQLDSAHAGHTTRGLYPRLEFLHIRRRLRQSFERRRFESRVFAVMRGFVRPLCAEGWTGRGRRGAWHWNATWAERRKAVL